MGDLSQDSYELMMTFISGLSTSLKDWARIELDRSQNLKEMKLRIKALKQITKDGIPRIQVIPPEAQAEKAQLYDMIKKYNKEHPKEPIVFTAQIYKQPIAINGVVHNAGSTLLHCNQRDYDLISGFTKEIFKLKDINIQELSNERFMNENLKKDALKIGNISANEMNLLKTRPWAHDSYDEAIKNLSFSFSSVPKLNSSYDVYVNSNDVVGQKNVLKLYENLMLSKALLSGPDGQIKNQQMDYERDLLKHALNVAKNPNSKDALYLTSAIDSGRYMTIESGIIKVYETGFSLKNFCGRKTLELSIEDLDKQEFTAETLKIIKSFKNPVMLSSLNECAIHCKTGEVIKECLDSKGNTIPYPALTGDILKEHSFEDRCDLLQNVFELAKKNITAKGLSLEGKNFITECNKIIDSLDAAKNTISSYEELKKEINSLEKNLKYFEESVLPEDKLNAEKTKEQLEEKTKAFEQINKINPSISSIIESEELTTAEKIRMLIIDNPNCNIDTPGFISDSSKSNFESAIESIMSVEVKDIKQIITETLNTELDSQKLAINENFLENISNDETVDKIKLSINTERLEWEFENFDSFSDILSEEIKDVDRGPIIVGENDKDAKDIFSSEELEEDLEEDNPEKHR